MSSNFFTPLPPQGLEPESPEFFKPVATTDHPKKIQQDTLGKKAARYLFQIPQALATKKTWPLNLIQQIGVGEALNELNELQERLPELKKKFPHLNWPESIDTQKYLENLQAASSAFPTVQNVARGIEEKTGIPLEAQTKGQKLLNLGATAASFRPGGIVPKATAGIVAPGVALGAEELGLPEGPSEFLGLLAGGGTPVPRGQPKLKPSGLPERGFEKLKKPTKVSPARLEKINEAVEGDVRKLTQNFLQDSKTYQALKEDSAFKSKITDVFDKVHDLAAKIDKPIPSQSLRSAFRKQIKQDYKGISLDEFEKNYFSDVRKIDKALPLHEMTAEQLVDQYRKNNKSLRELLEPGKSRAANRAKTESILAYNRAIADTIEKEFPNSELNNLFKFSNKRWAEIKDSEAIDAFMDDLFKGKINYKKGAQFFERERMAEPFKRLMGENNYKQFQTLMGDLMSSEKAMSLIKKAESQGFKDVAKAAAHWIVHPSLAKASAALQITKGGMQALLDKPQYIVKWRSALQNMKKGHFEEAIKEFNELNKALLTKTDRSDQRTTQ